MEKIIILSLAEEKNIFKPPYKIVERGNFSAVTVKNSPRAIKKIKKLINNAEVVISHRDESARLWKDKIKVKKDFSYKTAMPVMEKICRQVARKYNVKVPFGEIYIMGCPSVACEITSYLSGLSRAFTIVSEESPLTNAYDELYFKNGTIIRHLPEFNNNLTEDSVIIRCNEEEIPLWAKIPVIDFTDKNSCSNLIVNVGRIYVNDENITEYAEMWGGKSGLKFFDLFREIPGESSTVDINISADEIFLLDTKGN